MRRNVSDNNKYNIDVSRSWVFGWHTCHKCKEDVRFEHMWVFKLKPIVRAFSWKYLYTSCADQKSDALEYINNTNKTI